MRSFLKKFILSLFIFFVSGNLSAQSNCWKDGDVITYRQSDWGDIPNGTNAASILNNNYDNVYASTGGLFEVGIAGSAGFSNQFTNSSNLLSYLPAAGAIGPRVCNNVSYKINFKSSSLQKPLLSLRVIYC